MRIRRRRRAAVDVQPEPAAQEPEDLADLDVPVRRKKRRVARGVRTGQDTSSAGVASSRRTRTRPAPNTTSTASVLPEGTEALKYPDGYRGDLGIKWTTSDTLKVICAIQCRCDLWWGWFPERLAVSLRATMLADGCRRCA